MEPLVIVTKDRVGLLADLSEMLANKGINIDSLSAEVSAGKAVIRIFTKSENEAKKILEKAGYKTILSDLVLVKLENKPGEISKIARVLADSKINIMNIHLLTESGNEGLYALRVSDTEKAREVLKELSK